jgi:cobalamin biosynthesis Mg chelatase CobN
MSDNIDYNELDRAVKEASRARSKSSSAPKTTSSNSVPVKTTPKATVQQPRRRTYMDFVGGVSRRKAPTVAKKVEAEPEKPKRVAHFATATPSMPAYRTASHQTLRPAPVKQIATPVAPKAAPVKRIAKPVAPVRPTVSKAAPAKPVAQPAAVRVAAKPEPTPEVAPEQAKETAAAAKNAVATLTKSPSEKSAPNANNYSLGVRSPFLRPDASAKVAKRPLGVGPNSSEFVQEDEIPQENEYTKVATKKDKKAKKTKVVKDSKEKPGWFWAIIIVLILAAGAGLGYLAYLILSPAL